MPKVQKTCIYSKKSKVLIVKSRQTCIYSKKTKASKSQTLSGTHWHRWLGFWFFWFFWVYAGLVTFYYQFFFWVYAGLVTFPYKMFDFFEYMQVWGTWGSLNLHILKKINMLMPKVQKNLHILKKIKSFDNSEKSPNLHILKKNKKIKNLRLYVGLTGIDDLVFDFLFFFLSICRFGDFSLSKLLIFLSICRFCALLASKCCFFEYMQVWWTSSLLNLHFCNQKAKTQNR